MDDNTELAGQRAGTREWLGLAVLGLATLLLSVDMTVLFLALPNLSADLAATSTEQLWIIDIYGFMIAGLLVTMGSLGDRIGRRRLLLFGGAAFGLASVLAAYSVSPEMLIASRALLGIAGATIMPSALALLTNMFPDPKQQGTAIAVFMSCFMGGAALGPVVGGAMLTTWWWGSVFLLNVPIMIVVIVAGALLLPEFRNPESSRLDMVSVLLSLAAVLPIIYGLKELARNGWSAVPVLTLVIGLVSGVVFLRRQRAQRDPLLDLTLFRRPAFSGAIGIMLFGSIMLSGLSLFFTLFLQLVKGYTPLQTGLWMVVSAVAMVVGSMIAPAVAQRIRPGIVLAGGMVVCAIGFIPIVLTGTETSIALPIVGIAVISAGAGGFGSLGTGLVMGAVEPEQAGSAASVSETSGELGVALGIALIGSLGTAVYRGLLTVPEGVPADAAQEARENITGAAAAAPDLQAESGANLLENARQAFTDALNTVAGVSAGIAIVLAIVAVAVLRTVQPTQHSDPAGDEPAPTDGPLDEIPEQQKATPASSPANAE